MDTLIPASLALIAAILFAAIAHLQRRALSDTDPTTGAFLSVSATAGLCWMLAPLFVEPAWFGSRAVWVFAAVGIFFPAMGQWMQIASVGAVGPALIASLLLLTPVFAVLIGLVWLDESLVWQTMLGLALTVAGLLLATWPPRGTLRGWPILALGQGALTLVSPLVATPPLWALVIGVTVMRSATPGWRHPGVAALVVAGAVLIVTRRAARA